MLQVAECVATLHASGIVHGDIKPANILLDRSGRFKLCDFDLGKARAHGTSWSLLTRAL
jgi:serine/threonine-protein kinase